MSISQFSSVPLYFITNEEQHDLMHELSLAMFQVKEMYATELSRMEISNFPYYSKQFFTKAEKEFIENCGVIRVSYVDDIIPISFKDAIVTESEDRIDLLINVIDRMYEAMLVSARRK